LLEKSAYPQGPESSAPLRRKTGARSDHAPSRSRTKRPKNLRFLAPGNVGETELCEVTGAGMGTGEGKSLS
jgi:hypothetical protein